MSSGDKTTNLLETGTHSPAIKTYYKATLMISMVIPMSTLDRTTKSMDLRIYSKEITMASKEIITQPSAMATTSLAPATV